MKNFTLEVIDYFLGLPEGFVRSFDRKEFYKQLRGMQNEQKLSSKKIYNLFCNLKKYGYVENDNHENKFVFTNKAKLAVVDRIASRSELDGQHRFVSFDIPEFKKLNRNRFRCALKRMGFIQIQKSLWVSNKNVGRLVQAAAVEYEVDEYVVYIASVHTNIDDHISLKFH